MRERERERERSERSFRLLTPRSGIVFKSHTLINGHTISFKSISNTYLLKKKEP